jgi:outer membrane receptor protein involved in Fe transport
LGSECALLNAQTASPSPSPGTQPGELNQITVTAVPPEDQVVPTARPINSVFGQDMGIIDTPRSVNVITRAQLEDRQIFSVQDLGQFSSGTYTPAEYGLDGIPYIRGIYAELFQNGQREIFYRNSVVPSFNSNGVARHFERARHGHLRTIRRWFGRICKFYHEIAAV